MTRQFAALVRLAVVSTAMSVFGSPAFAQWDPQCSSYCNASVDCNAECHVEYYITTCGDQGYSCSSPCINVEGNPTATWYIITAIDQFTCSYQIARGYSRRDSCTGALIAGPTPDSYCHIVGSGSTGSAQCESWYNQGKVVTHCNE